MRSPEESESSTSHESSLTLHLDSCRQKKILLDRISPQKLFLPAKLFREPLRFEGHPIVCYGGAAPKDYQFIVALVWEGVWRAGRHTTAVSLLQSVMNTTSA